ncbi:MAG TPA: 4'-phosphopantetheinyl transferase superfamily protein [Vulgatibacter sp.]|nr:4'-phosphopantetheinyl transferase superfamily protein [Vulgatibacter sp.]
MNDWPALAADDFAEGSVHVIGIDVSGAGAGAGLEGLLDEGERRRSAAFRAEIDRRRFRAGRVSLRLLLGRILGCSPVRVPLAEGPHGKPVLAPDAGVRVGFNVSHSGDLVLVAIARNRELGVDVERHSGVDIHSIASTVFSSREQAALLEMEPSAQADAFFRLWARKEAILKAEGGGFLLPTTTFSVTLARDDARLLEGMDPRRWWLRDLPVPEGYAAALAVEGGEPQLHLWSGEDLVVEGAA